MPVGDFPAADLHLGESGDGLIAITRDHRGQVHRWSLPDGTYLGRLDAPTTYALCSGRRADGRLVLLTLGEGMSLWDLVAGTRLPLRVPDLASKFHAGVLSTRGTTVLFDSDVIVTFDPATGEVLGPPLRQCGSPPAASSLTEIVREESPDPGRRVEPVDDPAYNGANLSN